MTLPPAFPCNSNQKRLREYSLQHNCSLTVAGKIALSNNVSYFSLHKCPVRRSQLSQRLQDQESTTYGMTADTPPRQDKAKTIDITRIRCTA